MTTIQVDTREHKGEVDRIERQFDAMGVRHFRSKLWVGDYQSLDNGRLVVDRKKDLQEIISNVTVQHDRFRRELIRAEESGIQIIVLCEHGEGIKCLDDIRDWDNPRLHITRFAVVNGRACKVPSYPNATTGPELHKTLRTISERYNVRFEFCDPSETGARIVQLLGGETDG